MKQKTSFLANTKYLCGLYMLLLLINMSVNQRAVAQEEAQRPNYAYIALEPDVITNYVSDNTKRLGYIRLTIEMMLDDPDNISKVEHHMPLLRATVIEVFGAKSDSVVRSLNGREEIRREILNKFKDLMLRETGQETINDVIFTKYLRQGG